MSGSWTKLLLSSKEKLWLMRSTVRDRLTRMLTMQLWELLEGTHRRNLDRRDKDEGRTMYRVSLNTHHNTSSK